MVRVRVLYVDPASFLGGQSSRYIPGARAGSRSVDEPTTMSQSEQGENHISLTTSGDSAIADARSVLSSFDLDDKAISEVSIDIAYTESDEQSDGRTGTGPGQPGRVRPGTNEATLLLGIFGEFQDGWFTIATADERIDCGGNVSATVSRLQNRKRLLERRPAEHGGNANYEYRLNTPGIQEAERLMDDD